MAVVREGKSGNGRITLCQPQDERRQPRYNLTPDAPRNHSEFEGDGARNARAYREHTHTHRHGRLYILDSGNVSIAQSIKWLPSKPLNQNFEQQVLLDIDPNENAADSFCILW